ncbi:MAG: imidazole glycerol phosphate synthase subunit HisH [Chloroflexota bacterium]|nr:imidazole glycerol phosphate synthase subunit HisH [Chloroflexota bacterium]NOG63060.1 imidazole glycerol phosphate synthase subunit HisH [Chloroflexota bacterium]GIK62872.1 MAG: imidazole glycerol phosphate synthase subunit HisH [Chloroflexota bacterium]
MIAIVDYGAGNLRSVQNTLKHVGAETKTVSKPSELDGADKIVLPGVGAFGAGMAALRESGFVEPIIQAAKAGVPLLGICLGMQYLFETSEEMGTHQGLGLLPGQVVKFPPNGPLVPHIGWNQLHIRQQNPLLRGVNEGDYAYFVHSYYVEAADPNDILASTDYGLNYASVVGRGNIFGIQCHPEKSQHVGQRILRNFVEDIH